MFPSKEMQTWPLIIASPILSQNKGQSLLMPFLPQISLTSYAMELMWDTQESSQVLHFWVPITTSLMLIPYGSPWSLVLGLNIPSCYHGPSAHSEKAWSPQILNSAPLHQCMRLQSSGRTGSLWLNEKQGFASSTHKTLLSASGADESSREASLAQKW